MIASNGFYIEQYPKEGKIVIGVPHSAAMPTNTMSGTMSDVSKGERILTETVMAVLLQIVIQQCERKNYQ